MAEGRGWLDRLLHYQQISVSNFTTDPCHVHQRIESTQIRSNPCLFCDKICQALSDKIPDCELLLTEIPVTCGDGGNCTGGGAIGVDAV